MEVQELFKLNLYLRSDERTNQNMITYEFKESSARVVFPSPQKPTNPTTFESMLDVVGSTLILIFQNHR